MLISVVAEETRPYLLNLLNAYEPFNFNFALLVIERDVSYHELLD